ncbi:MAG: hypothetical protein ACRC4M_04160 [Mycoplasma sp.]
MKNEILYANKEQNKLKEEIKNNLKTIEKGLIKMNSLKEEDIEFKKISLVNLFLNSQNIIKKIEIYSDYNSVKDDLIGGSKVKRETTNFKNKELELYVNKQIINWLEDIVEDIIAEDYKVEKVEKKFSKVKERIEEFKNDFFKNNVDKNEKYDIEHLEGGEENILLKIQLLLAEENIDVELLEELFRIQSEIDDNEDQKLLLEQQMKEFENSKNRILEEQKKLEEEIKNLELLLEEEIKKMSSGEPSEDIKPQMEAGESEIIKKLRIQIEELKEMLKNKDNDAKSYAGKINDIKNKIENIKNNSNELNDKFEKEKKDVEKRVNAQVLAKCLTMQRTKTRVKTRTMTFTQ